MLDLRCSILDSKDASGYRTRFQKYPFSTTVLVKSVETAWIFFRFRFKKVTSAYVFWGIYLLLHYYMSGLINTYFGFGKR